ncbi:kinase-like domain-containing protein [Suillus spraguei]|nr:kinase-like domain-containing protein [Suillus spraguei]
MDSSSRRPTAGAEKLTLTPVFTLEGHKRSIPSISFLPDGKRMISGSSDKTTRQWDLEAGKEIKEARDTCEQEVDAVAVSRNGRWIVTSAGGCFIFRGGELKVCEVQTGIVRTFEGSLGRITCIDISGDSTLLASGAQDCTVQIWNLETGKLVAGPLKSADQVIAIRFSHDSKKVAVKLWWTHLEVWDVQTQKLDIRVGSSFGGLNFTFTPVFWTTKDKTITTSLFTTIREFNASTLNAVGVPFKGHAKDITGLAFSSDYALLASAAYDNTIKLWAFESRQLLASFDVLSVHHLIFSPNSRQLFYTTLRNNNIYLCNTPPEILSSIPLPQVRISASSKLPLVDSGALSLTANQSTSEALPDAQPSYSIPPLPISFTRRPARFEFKSMGPPPPPRIPPRELLPSSSHTDVVFSTHNVEPDDPPSKAMLHDLSNCITKDGDYPVARGGFGEIWKCTSTSITDPSKFVAVKALQVYAADNIGAAKTKKIKRIKRELRICAKLQHPNILPVYGYTYGFGPFIAIVSPWAENGNLSDYLDLEGATLTLVRRFKILRDIIAGLRYLHANSVIHGDFTGPNVLILGDGTACVADFGLSLMYSEFISASQASWTSNLKGNVRWMAPELLEEREDGTLARPSEQSDIFSFGGIMLQVLTNNTPYYYLRNDAAIIWAMQKSEKPSRPRYSVLAEKYWEFIEQCWSTDPGDRPSTEGADAVIRNELDTLPGSH